MSEKEKLTEEQVTEMLEKLSKHFREPVMPVSKYCDKLYEWERAYQEKRRRQFEALFPGDEGNYKGYADIQEYKTPQEITDFYKSRKEQGDEITPEQKKMLERHYAMEEARRTVEFCDEIAHVFRQIRKSYLLARTMYGGEKPRTEMCPVHKGKWNGQAMLMGNCPHQCDGSGWLRNQK